MSESSIFALATPPGRSALHNSISGYNLANQIASFLPKGKVLLLNQPVYTTWSFNGLLVDDIILLYFQSLNPSLAKILLKSTVMVTQSLLKK